MKAIRVNFNDIANLAGVFYVRTEAMTLGYDIPLDKEFSDDSVNSLYILVIDDNKPVSTCRINMCEGYAKIERVATVSYKRGCGAASLAIKEAESYIKESGINLIKITSREKALDFYLKLGYIVDETKEKYGKGEFVCLWIYKEI